MRGSLSELGVGWFRSPVARIVCRRFDAAAAFTPRSRVPVTVGFARSRAVSAGVASAEVRMSRFGSGGTSPREGISTNERYDFDLSSGEATR